MQDIHIAQTEGWGRDGKDCSTAFRAERDYFGILTWLLTWQNVVSGLRWEESNNGKMGCLTRLRHQKTFNLLDPSLSHSSINPLEILTVGCHRVGLVEGIVFVEI
ncbi:hypothetical protein NEOLEDRAFT_1133823 [Neolentinus lepideus HHB14362 ss-1]|uniref:Uncharacterized protein n=1 Tax=Neolentinus lepideus HHB14362 ss-1 TaxID=1314782 RepID=A0A165SNT1_9AGAM|nr:hypothetical protein NEOLEDRAFT_1133823 [Neolentinus lepideus HHB14362 ss-1]